MDETKRLKCVQMLDIEHCSSTVRIVRVSVWRWSNEEDFDWSNATFISTLLMWHISDLMSTSKEKRQRPSKKKKFYVTIFQFDFRFSWNRVDIMEFSAAFFSNHKKEKVIVERRRWMWFTTFTHTNTPMEKEFTKESGKIFGRWATNDRRQTVEWRALTYVNRFSAFSLPIDIISECRSLSLSFCGRWIFFMSRIINFDLLMRNIYHRKWTYFCFCVFLCFAIVDIGASSMFGSAYNVFVSIYGVV